MDEKVPESTRQALLDAAVKLFAQYGFDGTTVKQIADSAGVNVSLVSYHFEGKENLYRACLERFGQNRLDLARRILAPVSSAAEMRIKLEMFLEEIISYHHEQPYISRLLFREIEGGLPLGLEIFKQTFYKGFETLSEFFRNAQSKNIVRSDADPKVLAAFLQGAIFHNIRTEPIARQITGISIFEKTTRERMKKDVLNCFLNGALVPEK